MILKDYQKLAVSFIKETKKCAIHLTPGSGKTIITLTALSDLLNENKIKKILIISKKVIVNTTWESEIIKHDFTKFIISKCLGSSKHKKTMLKDENANLFLINCESVSLLYELGYKDYFDIIVLDESSCFKNHKSKRFKSLSKFSYNYMIQLTGTPISNGYEDIWSQIYLLDGGKSLGKTYYDYLNIYFYKYTKWDYKVIDSSKITKNIKHLVFSLGSLSSLNNILNKTIKITKIKHNLQKEYIKLKDKFLKTEEGTIAVKNAAVLFNKSIQFSSGVIYDEDGKEVFIHDLKIKVLENILNKDRDNNYLIVYNFKHELKRLQNKFPESVAFTGTFEQQRDWNKGKIRLILCHPASVGYGLNLQYGGYNIIWFSLTPNLEHYIQLNHRLYRQGQINNVIVNHLILDKTREEDLIKELNLKNITQNNLLDNLINCINKPFMYN